MSDSSLGTLGVNVAAYAGQFMAELTKAEGSMNKFQRSISKTLTKAGLDTIGLGNAARALSNELKYVWENIEKIPGIDPLVIASVQEMKTEVEDFKNAIHSLVAEGMALFSQFGKSLGMVAGAIATAFNQTSLKEMFLNPAAFAGNFVVALKDVDAALQAEFDSAVKAAQAQNQLAITTAKVTVAKKESAAAYDSIAQQIAIVTKQQEELTRSDQARLQQMMEEGEAIRREVLTPQEEWAEQLVRLDGLLNAAAISQETFNRAMKAADVKLATDEASDSADRIAAIKGRVFGPAEEAVGDFNEILSAGEQFQGEMNNLWGELSARGSDSFAELLLTGENTFGSLVTAATRAMARMAAELLLINPILNGLSASFGVTSVLPAAWSFGGGKAVGGPVTGGTSYLVGEKGPELFTPDTSGAIIPNHALKSGGGGNKYYIDARGTDSSVVARLALAIKQLAGPGVVEQRALGAVIDARRRGASAL